MTGLKLAERYFLEWGTPMLARKFPSYQQRIAAGLVGDGSECFGFDDVISRDHDWGPGFCLWLTKQDYESIGRDLHNEINKLPRHFAGFKTRRAGNLGEGNVGVFEISEFYRRFIFFDHVPASLMDWRVIPEANLAAATNGQVFTDPLGAFTTIRKQLKAFYPEDIRLEKIASRCMTMAQSGQYNYMRCVQRKEFVAANWAESEFVEASISMVFLLNKRYKPFYKWMHRAMKDLPILGENIYKLLSDLVIAHEVESGPGVYARKYYLIEEICQLIIQELRRQGLSHMDSDFLLDHGPLIQSKIKDEGIRSINVWG